MSPNLIIRAQKDSVDGELAFKMLRNIFASQSYDERIATLIQWERAVDRSHLPFAKNTELTRIHRELGGP
jgi:hypothetical protein